MKYIIEQNTAQKAIDLIVKLTLGTAVSQIDIQEVLKSLSSLELEEPTKTEEKE